MHQDSQHKFEVEGAVTRQQRLSLFCLFNVVRPATADVIGDIVRSELKIAQTIAIY
jgi:hypothetical protein